jgi:molybdate transport system regulatory protein
VKLSARNVLPATITKVTRGAVSAEVELALRGGDRVVASITLPSVESLGLQEGTAAYAIIKASSVMVAKGIHAGQLSARNVLDGTVARVRDGVVNCEVDLDLPGGSAMVAVITTESCETLGLTPGDPASAVFKASSVMVGVDHGRG